MKRTSPVLKVKVTADADGLVSHAGSGVLVGMAEAVGLTGGLSEAMRDTRQRRGGHDPGRVLIDLAVMLADGGDCLSDLKVLREQPGLFGDVASDPTAWRVIDSIDELMLNRIAQARASARRWAWDAGMRPGWIVLDIDSTLITAHSDKQWTAATYKRGFGFHPLICTLDGTGEMLAGMLRPGNAGSGTAADHVTVLDAAIGQLPVKPKGIDPEHGQWMLVRGDSAACSHDFLNDCRRRGIEFSVGFSLTEHVRNAVCSLPERAWTEAVAQDGVELREEAWVAEVTHLLDLTSWPAGTRCIVRRELPHPGAQLTFSDAGGHRFQTFITDSPDPDLAFLEARHRGHARVEDRIRHAKDTGLRNLPFHDFARNQVWLQLVLIALDLFAWIQRLCVDEDLADAEPKRLRYTFLHCAGRIVCSGRQVRLRLQATWPWAAQLAAAYTRVQKIALLT